MISEERLREIVRLVLSELDGNEKPSVKRRKIYMLCTSSWDDRYLAYLKKMEDSPEFDVYPVIPLSWKKRGLEQQILACPSCRGIICRSCERPGDLAQAITVFPVVPRDVVAKTALCISDTYETGWISSCIALGSQVIFAGNGLEKFTGKEPDAYRNQILSYYRTVLTYGITICGDEKALPVKEETSPEPIPEAIYTKTGRNDEKKRVITASNVDKLASNGVLIISRRDVVTDLAKDRAKFLNIVLKEQDCEVKR